MAYLFKLLKDNFTRDIDNDAKEKKFKFIQYCMNYKLSIVF